MDMQSWKIDLLQDIEDDLAARAAAVKPWSPLLAAKLLVTAIDASHQRQKLLAEQHARRLATLPGGSASIPPRRGV